MNRPAPSRLSRGRLSVCSITCAGLLGLLSGCGVLKDVTKVMDGRTATPDLITNTSITEVKAYTRVGGGFTEGLVFHQGVLFESTGPAGSGGLRRVSYPLATPADLQAARRSGLFPRFVPNELPVFPEGIASDGEEMFQLTLNHGFARVWDPVTMVEKRRVHVRGEGWGLCYDRTRKRFIRSDGSPTLHFHDPGTFKEDRDPAVGTRTVMLAKKPLEEINELECTPKSIYANVWFTNQIVRIDPDTFKVTHVFDATAFAEKHPRKDPGESENVLNGIAYDKKSGHFFLTGKRWDKLYEVTFEPDLEEKEEEAHQPAPETPTPLAEPQTPPARPAPTP